MVCFYSGVDNGDPVTTAVIEWGGFVSEANGADTDNGSNAAYQSLKGALANQAIFNQITLEDWRENAYQASNCSTQASKRSEFNRFKTKLLNDGVIELSGDAKIVQVLDQDLINLGNIQDIEEPGIDS